MPNIIESTLSGGKDFLFGKEGSTDVRSEDLLTPEQRAALNKQLAKGRQIPGSVGGTEIDTSGLSLEALAEHNAQLAQGQAAQTLTALAEGQGPDSDFIRTNIRDPLTKEAQEAKASIGRESAGEGTFFSSDRLSADKNIDEAFATATTQAIADLGRESQALSLQAAQGLTDINRLEMEGRVASLNAELQLAMKNGDLQQAALIQDSLNELQAQALQQQLITTPTKENIALVTDPTEGAASGILSGLAQGAGAAAGAALSDIRLKQNIFKISSLLF